MLHIFFCVLLMSESVLRQKIRNSFSEKRTSNFIEAATNGRRLHHFLPIYSYTLASVC